jgi:hypothetical protein
MKNYITKLLLVFFVGFTLLQSCSKNDSLKDNPVGGDAFNLRVDNLNYVVGGGSLQFDLAALRLTVKDRNFSFKLIKNEINLGKVSKFSQSAKLWQAEQKYDFRITLVQDVWFEILDNAQRRGKSSSGLHSLAVNERFLQPLRMNLRE